MTQLILNVARILQTPVNILLYALLQGKPDPSEPFETAGINLRSRIKQSPQKGPTCFFYALNILRERIGPNAPAEYQKKRDFEVLWSGFRKQMSEIVIQKDMDKTLYEGVHYLFQDLYAKLGQVDSIKEIKKEGIEKLYAKLEEVKSKYQDDEELKRCNQKLKSIFNDFFKQTEANDLLAFFKKEIKKITPQEVVIYSKFLKKFKEQASDLYLAHQKANDPDCIEENVKSQFNNYLSMKSAPFSILQPIAHAIGYQAFDFKSADWNPTKSIDQLQTVLKEKGALVASGLFSQEHYDSSPYIKYFIAGRSIYGWPLNACKKDNINGHAIVVIGAAKGGSQGGYVYFVDPNDGSDPDHPETQKIYEMTYVNFINSIVDSDGKLFTKARLSSFGYVFYHDADHSVSPTQA